MNGFVYAIRCEGFIKIGWSRNPKGRLRTAQTMNPLPCTLLGFYPADEKTEELALHARFADLRHGASEWFRAEGDLLEWAANLVVPGADDALATYFAGERGRRTRLAESLGVTPSTISQWQEVPVEKVVAVEAATGISRTDLRPDIFEAAQ